MPRSKNWLTYPTEFHDLLKMAVIRPIELPTADLTAAKKLQGTIYGFFAALDKELKKGGQAEEVARELRNLSYRVKLRVQDNGTLLAYPADMDPAAKLIREALHDQADNKPLESEAVERPSVAFLEKLEKEKE